MDKNQIIMLVVLAVLMVGMFAMSIIPQKKRQKKAQEMMNSIKVGSKVKTIGGFVGEVKRVEDGNFTLDISANNDGSVMVNIDRSAIYVVLEAVKTDDGAVKLQEKPEVTALDDMEADEKKKKSKSGDSLDKTDNETLLKD